MDRWALMHADDQEPVNVYPTYEEAQAALDCARLDTSNPEDAAIARALRLQRIVFDPVHAPLE